MDIASFDPNDLRRDCMLLTPAKGLTLRQAMLYYDELDRRAAFLSLEQSPYDVLNDLGGIPQVNGTEFERLKEAMMAHLMRKLMTGTLVATGYSASSGLDEPPQVIASDRWRTLSVDIAASVATAPGIAISGILVFKRRPQRASRSRTSAGAGPVRRWYDRWVAENVAADRQPSRDDDEAAAREALGRHVSRALLRRLRSEIAPEEWKRRGRPKGSK